jgi:uncharacterized protein YecA (UPF0149 family)
MMNDTTNSTPQENSLSSTEKKPEPQTGRNEPCPCGSGKKFKRCHGVDAAPKLTQPTTAAMPAGALPGGFDPSQMDPAMMQQMAKSLQRLPRGQLTKLQSIMQRAMSGQDVTQEAAQFERMLPPEFQQMAMQMMMAQNMASAGGAVPAADAPMDADEAKKIVAKAVAEGKMTEAQAKELLGDEDPKEILERAEKKGISKFFGKLTGK